MIIKGRMTFVEGIAICTLVLPENMKLLFFKKIIRAIHYSPTDNHQCQWFNQ